MTREKMNAILEAVKRMREGADDRVASLCPDLYPALHGTGDAVEAGTRILWNGKVMRAAVALWDREDNNPDNAPGLWEELEYRDGIRVIPQVITVGKAFGAGELGWWGDVLCRSRVDVNVYTPEQYAGNWDMGVEQ